MTYINLNYPVRYYYIGIIRPDIPRVTGYRTAAKHSTKQTNRTTEIRLFLVFLFIRLPTSRWKQENMESFFFFLIFFVSKLNEIIDRWYTYPNFMDTFLPLCFTRVKLGHCIGTQYYKSTEWNNPIPSSTETYPVKQYLYSTLLVPGSWKKRPFVGSCSQGIKWGILLVSVLL